MESKRKTRRVRKVKEVREPQQTIKATGEHLIRRNGTLVEALLESEVWADIVLPLVQEQIAGVSGRYSGGRFYPGELIRKSGANGEFLAGYQKALMDFLNGVDDFVRAKNKLLLERAQESDAKKQPYENPFLKDSYEEQDAEDA